MGKRLDHEQYTPHKKIFRENFMKIIAEQGQKKLRMGFLPASTVSSWVVGDDVIPNVVLGALIARTVDTSVEEMVFGVKPVHTHHKGLDTIVAVLEPYADEAELMIEIRGVIKDNLARHSQKTPSAPAEAAVSPELRRATSGGRPLLNNKKKKDII